MVDNRSLGPLDVLKGETAPRWQDDPFGIEEMVACCDFPQKCTHLGCVVFWQAEEDRLYCPCHEGEFDPRSGDPTVGHPNVPWNASTSRCATVSCGRWVHPSAKLHR